MKMHSLAVLIALGSASMAQADTVLGVYAGVGSWNTQYSGEVGSPSVTLQELGVKSKNNTYVYVALEHPVPLVPNVLLERVSVSAEQTATLTKGFTLDGVAFNAGVPVASQLDLSHTSATFYYEILDNWVNLDLGLTLRQYDGLVSVKAVGAGLNKSVDINQVLPLAYGKAQFDLPFSGLSVGLQGNYISYSDSKLADYSAKVSYVLEGPMDIGVEAGYRQTQLTIDESDLKGDLDLKGPYAALIAHF